MNVSSAAPAGSISRDSIYLDHAATTPISPAVADAMREAALAHPANPASQHGPGRAARLALESARDEVAQLLGAQTAGMDADRVIFTSGGTEANNLALFGLHRESQNAGDQVILSAIEHPSVAQAAAQLATTRDNHEGTPVAHLPADADGVTLLDRLPELLQRPTRMVSLMLGNNETGVLQPVREAAALCQSADVPLHTDATQAIGKVPAGFAELGVAAMSCTAHKFHGPLGVGVLLLRHGVRLSPDRYGGFQQGGLRPGTESVALAVGFVTALRLAIEQQQTATGNIAELRERLEQAILASCEGSLVVGQQAQRLPHIANFAFTGCDRQALVMALDQAGVACSTGSACASGSSEPSPTLLAMGLPEEQISGSVRLSLSATTTAAEIDEAARRISNAHRHLRS